VIIGEVVSQSREEIVIIASFILFFWTLGGVAAHFNVTIGQSVKEQVSCHLLILIASQVGLGSLNFTEA